MTLHLGDSSSQAAQAPAEDVRKKLVDRLSGIGQKSLTGETT